MFFTRKYELGQSNMDKETAIRKMSFSEYCGEFLHIAAYSILITWF